ncbi:M48 family metallopeptidase [Actinacidiphila acidipaludis]|uniref:M48 family metalloprotease n=1 Tax=Actinacidiphila acidipaludis TaxID=2873382 RepID=A0ABS7Q200_9ACTN|nr:M48 family metallopeptidase [Streptomyces acidipaludis]MBY8877165.1 M48 family metalloprotease [Streptomyces acidipaludis]
MNASLRAARALLLLAGFYLMGLVLLGLVLTLDAFVVVGLLHGHALFALVKLLLISLALTVPVLDGMLALVRRKGDDGPDGYEVTARAQPELWAEVGEAARLAGTRAPDRVVLIGDVNAAVAERTRLLGLVPGRRSLYLGVPLLTGLTVPRLRAVLAHEFGHYGHRDTRLAGITMRGRVAMTHTIESFRAGAADGSRGHAFLGNLYVRYARFYLRASQSVARRQELAADRAAALAVGRRTTAAALREVPLLSTAFGFYVTRYATAGRKVSLLPPAGEFYGGFRHLLADSDRGEELARMRAGLLEEEQSPYDSHPPTAERVRLIEELPDDGRPDDPSAPAGLSLLRDRAAVLASVESATLVAEVAGFRRVGWADLFRSKGWSAATAAAEPLRKAVFAVRGGNAAMLPTIEETLDAIDAGRLWTEIAPRLPLAGSGTPQNSPDELRSAVRDGLTALAHLALAHADKAHWELSWSGAPIRLVLPPDVATRLPAAVEAASAPAPDTTPLRRLLSETENAATGDATPAAETPEAPEAPGAADPAPAAEDPGTADAPPSTRGPQAVTPAQAAAHPGTVGPTPTA